jgi:uncharacterized protein YjbI with pentapeptide repeats
MDQINFDFKGRDLRGRSFKQQDLTGFDFSSTDIRGADFTNANLACANFSSARAGQNNITCSFTVLSMLFFGGLGGLIVGWAGGVVSHFILASDNPSLNTDLSIFAPMAAISIPVFLLGLLYIIVNTGLGMGLAGYISLVTFVLTLVAAITPNQHGGIQVVWAIIIFLFIASVIVAIGIESIVLGIGLKLEQKWIKSISITTIMLFTFLGAHQGAEAVKLTNIISKTLALIIPSVISIIALAFGLYLSHQAYLGNPKFRLISILVIKISQIGGTCFYGAQCVEANFSNAVLNGTDFREACLKRTDFYNAKGLDDARLGNGYLSDPRVRRLATSRVGEMENYDYCNLREINIQGANLKQASLIGADLSEANLVGVNFTDALLVKAKLYGVNLSNACLTGACIEDWAISTDLIYNNISCDYVFMRLSTQPNRNPCRKPDNWDETFKDGDFADFIFPYIERLTYYTKAYEDPRELGKELKFEMMDLYHYNDFNSSAALIALKTLASNYPEANLEVLSFSVRGENKVHIKLAIKGHGDTRQLNPDYHRHYASISRSSSLEIQNQIILITQENDKFSRLLSLFAIPREHNVINVSVGRDISGILNIGTINGAVSNVMNPATTSSHDL